MGLAGRFPALCGGEHNDGSGTRTATSGGIGHAGWFGKSHTRRVGNLLVRKGLAQGVVGLEVAAGFNLGSDSGTDAVRTDVASASWRAEGQLNRRRHQYHLGELLVFWHPPIGMRNYKLTEELTRVLAWVYGVKRFP